MPRPTDILRERQRGFTLVEILVVLAVIAILAAIAIPTYPHQRAKAQDAEAKSLVRNAMTVIEAAYVDSRTFDPTATGMTPADLHAMERPITFALLAGAATAPSADAEADTVNYTGTASTYSVGTVSASGHSFGVIVDRASGTTHYVGGVAADW